MLGSFRCVGASSNGYRTASHIVYVFNRRNVLLLFVKMRIGRSIGVCPVNEGALPT